MKEHDRRALPRTMFELKLDVIALLAYDLRAAETLDKQRLVLYLFSCGGASQGWRKTGEIVLL